MVSFWWLILLAVVLIVIFLVWFISARSGVLRIDRSNPEKDVYRFDVSNLDTLPKKKYILLKVDTKANLSQK